MGTDYTTFEPRQRDRGTPTGDVVARVARVDGSAPAGDPPLTVRAFKALDRDRRARLAADLAAHWARHRRPAAPTAADQVEVRVIIASR